MSLAVENSRKLNSPETTSTRPDFRRTHSNVDDNHNNSALQYNSAVHRQQKTADKYLCRQGSSSVALVLPDTNSGRLSPVGFTTGSSYNAANASQVDPVKVSDVNH